MEERRGYPRVQISWPVRLWVEEAALTGQVKDVSAFGVGIVIAPAPSIKLGQTYRLDVLPERTSAFSFVAEVRHVGDRGIGLATRKSLNRTGWFE